MPFRRTSVDSSQRTGFYSPKRSRVVGSRLVFPTDPDAAAYIAAVESADGQELEFPIKVAYNDFVLGCKADGIWTALKASCIMAGARTLAGALTPLVGTAPTNNNFVAGDYNRAAGLVGDGSTKYLNAGTTSSTGVGDNNQHLSVCSTSAPVPSGTQILIGYGANSTFPTVLGGVWYRNTGLWDAYCQSDTSATDKGSGAGFIGVSRSSSTSYLFRAPAAGTSTENSASVGIPSGQVAVYAVGSIAGAPVQYSNARLAFYSIGESLDLALLDSRVTTLMADIAAAIP